ncbi:hypothetical protein K3G39_01010 [Pontibacter sp. HSC-14F20]|nr:hypothetical protein [Pontibacter sp. HSC-14F20]
MLLLLLLSETIAQYKIVAQDEQIGFGYMTTCRVSKRFLIWNNVHYIPAGFGIIRTCLTTHFPGTATQSSGPEF